MNIIRILTYSNTVVSFSMGALTTATAHYMGNKHYFVMGIIAFLSTMFTYNIQRVLRLNSIDYENSDRLQWVKRNIKTIKIIAALTFFGAVDVYFFVLGRGIDFWFLAATSIFGVIYALRLTPKLNGLRDIPYIKIYLISILWTFVAVVWPFIRLQETIDFPWELALSIFFYILACTIPFDIRDLEYDSPLKRTIPQIIGEQGARTVALIFLFISATCLYIQNVEVISSPWYYISYLVMAVSIAISRKTRTELFFSGWIDFWIVSYAVLIWMIN